MIIRVGIVGAGSAGRNIHGKNVGQRPDRFQVAAFAEPAEKNAELAREAFGVPVYSTLDEMLDPDGLCVWDLADGAVRHLDGTGGLSVGSIERTGQWASPPGGRPTVRARRSSASR